MILGVLFACHLHKINGKFRRVNMAVAIGTDWADTMSPGYSSANNGTPTEWADSIYGYSGDDWLDTGDGNDYVAGGSGADVIYGGLDGNPLEENNDNIDGGSGIDVLYGESGNNTIYGGSDVYWDDYLYNNDYINGGIGDDWISGGSGNDIAYGGDGVDTIYGGAGADIFDFWEWINDEVKDFNALEGDTFAW
jgi:Ca2+-binding RTX toxin-like protein